MPYKKKRHTKGKGRLAQKVREKIAIHRALAMEPDAAEFAADYKKWRHGQNMARGTLASRELYGYDWESATPKQRMERTKASFYGKGDYKSLLKYGSRGLGALSGAALGSMSGGGWGAIGSGAQSGWDKGAGFSRYMGWGDYEGVSSNDIMQDAGSGSQQTITVNRDNMSGDIIVERTEFIQNIQVTAAAAGTSAFSIVSLPINPGMSSTFPFLSQLAQNYTMWEAEGIIFQYKPTSGEYGASSSNQLGKVIFATNYDPDAVPFISSVEMENYDYANSTKPSCGMLHGIETAKSQRADNMNYVRTGATTKDLVFTDIGTFYYATEGIAFGAAGTAVIGELWVTYKMRLSRAKLYGALLGNNIQVCQVSGTADSSAAVLTQTSAPGNSLSLAVANLDVRTFSISFPPNIVVGTYLVLYTGYIAAGNFASYVSSVQSITNCSVYSPVDAAVSTGTFTLSKTMGPSFPTSTVNKGIVGWFIVKVQAPGNAIASLQLRYSNAFPSAGNWLLNVQQVPDQYADSL
jgi:hypothetical protein